MCIFVVLVKFFVAWLCEMCCCVVCVSITISFVCSCLFLLRKTLNHFLSRHTKHTSMSASASSLGYGPSSASAAAAIPTFDGNRAKFSEFRLKALCVFQEQHLSVVFDTEKWKTAIQAAKERDALKRRLLEARTRGEVQAGANTDPALYAGETADEVEGKSSRIARILLTRLSKGVLEAMRLALPSEESLFDGALLWQTLQVHYGVSAARAAVEKNPETLFLEILRTEWPAGRRLSVYLRDVQLRLQPVLLHARVKGSDHCKGIVTSL